MKAVSYERAGRVTMGWVMGEKPIDLLVIPSLWKASAPTVRW